MSLRGSDSPLGCWSVSPVVEVRGMQNILCDLKTKLILNQILHLNVLFIGFCIYGFYGIVHSEQGKRDKIENEKLQQKYIEKFKIITSFW